MKKNTKDDLRKCVRQRFFLSFFLVKTKKKEARDVLTETQSRKESVAAATFTKPSAGSIPTPWRTNLQRRWG